MGLGPRGQRTAVGAVLVLVAFSGGMHWQLPGFHANVTGFGGWPAMLATVGGLFCAAWAAQCRRPVVCGAVAGLAVLFNVTVVPGVAVVCVALLATSGASLRRVAWWAATAGCAALAVCAWWLVPFVAGWDRLVRWEVGLREVSGFGGTWGIVVVTAVALGGLGPCAAARCRRGGWQLPPRSRCWRLWWATGSVSCEPSVGWCWRCCALRWRSGGWRGSETRRAPGGPGETESRPSPRRLWWP